MTQPELILKLIEQLIKKKEKNKNIHLLLFAFPSIIEAVTKFIY